MTIVELYKKIPVAKHQNIKIVGNVVLYDSGTEIYQAYLGSDGELIPATQATKVALNNL